MVAIIMAAPLAKFTIAAVTSSVSSRNEAADSVPSTMLRYSSAFELILAEKPAMHQGAGDPACGGDRSENADI